MPPNADITGSGLSLSGCFPVPVPADGAVLAVPRYRLLLAASSTTTLVVFPQSRCF